MSWVPYREIPDKGKEAVETGGVKKLLEPKKFIEFTAPGRIIDLLFHEGEGVLKTGKKSRAEMN